METLFCFGLGYTAKVLARRLAEQGWTIAGTTTTPEGLSSIAALGARAFLFDGTTPVSGLAEAVSGATHVLVSVPPDEAGDPVLRHFEAALAAAPRLAWIGYLSTIGVYGDRDGAWVDEDAPPAPLSPRSRWRVAAEEAWLDLGRRIRARVQVFRLSGIYGPGRSAIDNLRAGTARRIVKPGQVFNRIHVDDIACVLEAAMARGGNGAIYNVTDDEPGPPEDVIAHAAALIGVACPPAVPFEEADLSPMAASFWRERKRVRNDRIKTELGVRLAYPTYREGLAAISGKFR